MPRAEQATIDFIDEYFDVMEAKDYARLGDYLADDITLTFANSPRITGKEAVRAQLAGIGGMVDSLAHRLVNAWLEDGGVVLFETDSEWRFPDGVETTIRACSIFTIADGKFTDMRIYVDNSPISHYLA